MSSSKYTLAPLTAAVLAALSLYAMPAAAEEPDASGSVVTDPVVVSATRTEKPLSEAASSLGVITSQEIEKRGYQTLNEALSDIPNVMVSDPDNPLFSRISIRGSDANQITYVIDGLRQDNYTLSGNRPIGVFLDPELVKQIEVKNGGGSALYGNGGIGGALVVTTKTAADFLRPGETFGVKAKTSYSSTTQELMGSAYAFGRWNSLDLLMAVTERKSGDAKMSDGKRDDYDTDTHSTSLMLKATFLPTDGLLASLTYNYDKYETDWKDKYTYWGEYLEDPIAYGLEQHRVTGSFEYANDKFFDLKANLQFTRQNYSFDQILGTMYGMGQGNSDNLDSWAGNIQNTNRFRFLANHTLTYGADFTRTRQTSLTYNPYGQMLGYGAVPDSTRPDSKSWDAGAFIQDEIALCDYFSVIPIVRYAYFERKSDNSEYGSFSDNKVLPGITLTLTPTKGLSFWASAIEGFRPPMLDELYYAMDPIPGLMDGYVDPNPDLKPEKSWNYEVGMNANFAHLVADNDQLKVKLALFYDDVKDFINIASWTDENWDDHYRAENIGHVVRKGIELSGTYSIGNFAATASYGLVHATDKETDRRVPEVTPQTFNLRLDYALPKQFLDLWYRLCWHDSTSHEEYDYWDGTVKTGYGAFMTHSIGLVWSPKIQGFWDFAAGIAVDNITNEKYRYFTGSTDYASLGYARNVRVWLSGRF